MTQQSTQLTRHVIGSTEPLTGEIVSATERVYASEVAHPASTSTAPAPTSVRLPGTVDPTVTAPAHWQWTAPTGPAPIEITIPSPPTGAAFTMAPIERREPVRVFGLPIPLLLSMLSVPGGAFWCALANTPSDPAPTAGVATCAAGLISTVVTLALYIRRDQR